MVPVLSGQPPVLKMQQESHSAWDPEPSGLVVPTIVISSCYKDPTGMVYA